MRGFGKSSGGSAFGQSHAGFGSTAATDSGSNLCYWSRPADCSSVSDPGVVVSFKGLQKKDDTTKVRALEELMAYVQKHPFEKDGGPEDAVLDAWAVVFPRLIFDNCNRVRELSATIMGLMVLYSRHRVNHRFNHILAPWYAAGGDSVSSVAKASQVSMSKLIATPEKHVAFATKIQKAVLQFVVDAFSETRETLSDERATTPEDMDAKYYRVVNASISLVCALLRRVSPESRASAAKEYVEVLALDKIWTHINSPDSSVRRAACTLFQLSTRFFPDSIKAQKSAIKKILLNDGLKVEFRGANVIPFLGCLIDFTEVIGPATWKASDKGGKSPISRLGTFVEKGSGTGNVQYWATLKTLLSNIPNDVWTLSYSLKFAASFRKGMATREDRTLVVVPWGCYNTLCGRILDILKATPDEAQQFATKALIPVLKNALGPPAEPNEWTIHGPPYEILSNIFATSVDVQDHILDSLVGEMLNECCNGLKGAISSSLPAVSAAHVESQQNVASWGRRWFSFSGEIRKSPSFRTPQKESLDTLDMELVQLSMELLQTRNFNPFGAAHVLNYALDCTDLVKKDVPGLVPFLRKAGTEHLALLLKSRVDTEIVAILHILGQPEAKEHAHYEEIWSSWITALVAISEEPESRAAAFSYLKALCSTEKSRLMAQQRPDLPVILVKRCLELVTVSDANERRQIDDILASNMLTQPQAVDLISQLLDVLDESDLEPETKYSIMHHVAAADAPAILVDPGLAVRFDLQLFALSETDDQEFASKAIALHMKLHKRDRKSHIPKLVKSSLATASPKALSIKSLSKLSHDILSSDISMLDQFLPSRDIWAGELKRMVNNIGVDPMLAITSPLDGAQFLVAGGLAEDINVARDRFGRSIPARLALFMDTVFEYPDVNLKENTALSDLLLLLAATSEVAADQISAMEEDQIMATPNARTVDFVSTSSRVISQLLSSQSWDIVESLVNAAKPHIEAGDAYSFYYARGLYTCLVQLQPSASAAKADKLYTDLNISTPSVSNALLLIVVTAAFREYLVGCKKAETICNKLIAETQGLKSDNPAKAHLILATLSHTLSIYPVDEVPVPQNRFMFALRALVPLASNEDVPAEVRGEAFRVLGQLLPNVATMFGPHWTGTLEAILEFWETSADQFFDVLSAVDTTLRLLKTLRSLEEPADELTEGLDEMKGRFESAILSLLFPAREVECQPQYVVDQLLWGFLKDLPPVESAEIESLEALFTSENKSVQVMALNLVRKALPKIQEDVIADSVLDKKTATFPQTIQDILANAPAVETFTDEHLDTFPVSVRRYLYGWLVVMDMYQPIPVSMRPDYTQALRESEVANKLFDFIFFVLGHSTGHAVNLDKEHITADMLSTYDVTAAEADEPEKAMNWLLCHLYFQSLKFMPELFRRWFIDLKSKATKKAVDEWTASFVSAPIITAVIDDVVQWAEEQEKNATNDDVALSVRVARATQEITAGYSVDEDEATIQLRIPKNFPLGSVEVVGTNRVGVNDKQWNTWMRLVQGVITFSNGSVIDGLIVYRRNMSGALKGQSECAICYAIVGEDKQMPNKRCGTCHKLFHKGCLYKWFQSSTQNTCPLCRNPIDYLGSDAQERRRRAQAHMF